MTTLIEDFEAFFGRHGRYYSEFYVGIAANPKTRLFTDHTVHELNDLWIHSVSPLSSEQVRAVEKLFLDKGAKGGGGGGDVATRYIYAYKISSSTRQ